MHVTIIDGDVSFPMTSGKRLRTLNLLLPLARRHALTYIGRSEGPQHSRIAAEFLADHGITPLLVEAPLQQKQGAAFYANLARNMISPLPYSATSHIKPAMRAAAVAHAAEHPVDLWQLEWSGYGYCVEGFVAPVVLQAHNVDALVWQRLHETETNAARRQFLRHQAAKMERFEGAAFRKADRVVTVSQADAALAARLYGALPLDIVDNGVDVGQFASLKPTPGTDTILYLGALDWRPNSDAVELLVETIFPMVRALRPTAKLAVVGRHPSAQLRQKVEACAGACLFADVPDVKPHLTGSAVMAVPLRLGGGSRLKILESLAAGLPVVSTAVGAEGLALEPGRHYVLAEAPREFATALVAALEREADHQAQAEIARKAVAQRYDWSMLAAQLEGIWEKTLAVKPRQ